MEKIGEHGIIAPGCVMKYVVELIGIVRIGEIVQCIAWPGKIEKFESINQSINQSIKSKLKVHNANRIPVTCQNYRHSVCIIIFELGFD